MKHKVLTVKQPWSFLICSGIKDIENRTWKCPQKYIGQRVLIHASGKPLSDGRCISHLLTKEQYIHLIEVNQGASAMDIMYFEHSNSAIIGSVEIVDWEINHPSIWAEKTTCDYIENRYYRGRDNPVEVIHPIGGGKIIYNWVLANPILFDKPILNVKGKLGFWNYELPGEYETILKL